MKNATLRGKPDAGNPHVRFDEGEVASAKPRRGSLLYRDKVISGACALCLLGVSAANLTVDFSAPKADFRPALHSSGYAPLFQQAYQSRWNDVVKEMNFEYSRTHDLGLVNGGSRAYDLQYVFPLIHLDAKDPKNYFFDTTDFMIKMQLGIGQKVFYRLGTSIEHTGLVHFAAEIPKDFDQVSEVFAGTMRHYLRGWANGMQNAVSYWEIWNEPDGKNNMWSFNGGVNDRDSKNNRNAERRDLFVKFFVTVLKRLKAEFPEVKIGGPALCDWNEDWARPILRACKAENLRPDFISWHYYGRDPKEPKRMAVAADKVCREEGFEGLEYILNEWHYIPAGGWHYGVCETDPDNANGINSAAYTLRMLSWFQTSRYDQAYFYGCNHQGQWGYRDYNTNKFNKNFYALKAFGDLKRYAAKIVATTSDDSDVSCFAVKSADGKKAGVLVVDYFGHDTFARRQCHTVRLAGAEMYKKASAVRLSHSEDLAPLDVKVHDGVLTLNKPDSFSAAWLVTFE